MKNKLSSLCALCFIVTACLITAVMPIYAESSDSRNEASLPGAFGVDEIDGLIGGIVNFNLNKSGASTVQEWIDGGLTDSAGEGAEWYIMALLQSGNRYDYSSYYTALVSYLKDNAVYSASTRQKYALTLTALGHPDDEYINSVLEASIGNGGIMSWVFGLHLLNNGCSGGPYTADKIIEKLLSLRLDDGGWALYGTVSDVDVTAMTVTALSFYYGKETQVSSAIDAAVELLSERQLESGGYSSFGKENPESTAQVITALSSIGLDPASDVRFIKSGNTLIDGMKMFLLPDGSFSHEYGGESNLSATYQAFYSLIALKRYYNGQSPLFVFSNNLTVDTGDENALDSESDTISLSDTENTSAFSEDEPTQIGSGPEVQTEGRGYKVWAYIGIAAAAVLAGAVMFICGKRHPKNYVFIVIIAACGALFIHFTDFQSADSYYGGADNVSMPVGRVTVSIRCDTVAGRADSDHIPADGTILPECEFEISEGESVYDVLVRAAKKFNIQTESKGAASGAYGLVYICGINCLYEFDYGDLSGWVYRVNGDTPSVGCGEYKLKDGDRIEWLYTCELGNDLD